MHNRAGNGNAVKLDGVGLRTDAATVPWREQQKEAARLDAAIEANLKELGYGG